VKIYRLDYKTLLHVLEGTDSNGYNYNPKEIDLTEWFTSERSAAVRRLELYKMDKLVGKKKDAQIWGVDIPTRKDALIEWMNEQQRNQWK
jgi:hypothetical protein